MSDWLAWVYVVLTTWISITTWVINTFYFNYDFILTHVYHSDLCPMSYWVLELVKYGNRVYLSSLRSLRDFLNLWFCFFLFCLVFATSGIQAKPKTLETILCTQFSHWDLIHTHMTNTHAPTYLFPYFFFLRILIGHENIH